MWFSTYGRNQKLFVEKGGIEMSEFERLFPKISNKVITEQDRVKIARKVGQREGWMAALKKMLENRCTLFDGEFGKIKVIKCEYIERELEELEKEES